MLKVRAALETGSILAHCNAWALSIAKAMLSKIMLGAIHRTDVPTKFATPALHVRCLMAPCDT